MALWTKVVLGQRDLPEIHPYVRKLFLNQLAPTRNGTKYRHRERTRRSVFVYLSQAESMPVEQEMRCRLPRVLEILL